MTMEVRGPGGVTIRFPDGTDAATIDRVMREAVGAAAASPAPGGATPAAAAPVPAAPAPSGRGGLLDVMGALGALVNPLAAVGQAAGGNPAMAAVGQGMTAGFSDELVGAGVGAVDAARGGSFTGGYNRAVDNQRGQLDRFREDNPLAAAGMETAGALATLPVTGALNVVRAPAAATGIGGAIARAGAGAANAAATGAAYGGAYGAGTAEGGPVERAIGAGKGAAFGGAVGAVTPAATGAARWIAQEAFGRPAAALANAVAPRQRATSAMRRAIIDDAASAGISPQQTVRNMEMAQRAGVPLKPLDIGESTRQLGRTAANLSPQGRDALNQAVDQRFTSQADRLIDTITAAAPGVNAPQTSRLLQDAARQANRRNYGRSYLEGANGVWHEGLEQLTVSPDMQAAIRDATRIGANEAALRGDRPPRNPFRQMPDGTINPIPDVSPTLEFWDHVKRSLDGQIGIQQRAGNREYAGQLTQLKNQLLTYLDRAVPSYAQARQTAASFFGADDALEAGRLFVRRTGDNAGVREAIDRMTPAERQLFGEGFATQMIEDLRNVPDRLTVINKVFQSPAARERFTLALGPQATDAMEAAMRIEAIMDLGRRAVQGNSTTAQQLIAQGLLGTGAGAAMTGGDFTNPTTYITAALTMGLARGVRGGMDRASQKMARELAEMLASNDPQVVRQAIGRIGSQPRVLDALRRGHTWITRALLPAVEGAGGSGAAGVVETGGGSQPAQAQD